MRGLKGWLKTGGMGRKRREWATIGRRSSTAELIREFNCQPYESEPVIDSTPTSLSIK